MRGRGGCQKGVAPAGVAQAVALAVAGVELGADTEPLALEGAVVVVQLHWGVQW